MTTSFKGVFTALITPFKDGKIDEQAFAKFIEWQIAEGVAGVVPCGTTGESPTLSHEEHSRVIELCVEIVNKRAKVIAGTGSNSTKEAILMTQHAEKAGADAALIVTPYYNKPTQTGLYEHFKAISNATNLPIFIYNIPGRSVINMEVETMARLAELPNIIGVKDATANLELPKQVKSVIGADFIQLSGEDATALDFNQNGGVGCISVTANILPRKCSELQNAFFAGDIDTANAIKNELAEINQVLFCETNPIPVKYAAALMGICDQEIRLPLTSPSEAAKEKIKTSLKNLGLI